ncbi:prepilin peptidase, partial [Rothia mucilaginosa]|uniref:prepilin peptidase n=1 Tax=Rothia mucilaginosa TaxID=43675 RepID=UPI003C7B6100
MLAELSRLYNAGGASVIAALVLGSYLLYFLWCALRLWRIDVREHRLPHRILIPLAIATYTALPMSLLFAGRPADIWRVIGAGLALWLCYGLLRILSFGALGRGDVKLAGILGGVLGYL